MSKKCGCIIRTVVTLAYAGCGAAKLAGQASLREKFFNWGWKTKDMKIMGAAEVAGAALLTLKPTRKLGCLILGAASICKIIASLTHSSPKDALPDSIGLIGLLCIFFKKKKNYTSHPSA
ncbi:DoxX family protein [Entomobacter blattae]|uniref:DoxX family protein n=1 Tax=Entomobacter blattae TaxID=2762277 RepID=A0A7H1NSA0_9PROT|nr:DoxX family protein [Entomobacter blattae]QNT78660.1 hypothetical protein JGUZn3_14360 [Entomobacter blattae]